MIIFDAFKKTLAIVALAGLFILSIQAIPVARATDATFNVTMTVDSEISINGTTTGTTTLADIQLLPNLSISNDVASNSQNNIAIETTNAAGYVLTLHATSSPAMQHTVTAATIANHNNGSSTAQWDTTAGNVEFGFSVFSSSDAAGDTGDDILDVFDDPATGDNNGTNADTCLGLAPNTDPSFANLGEDLGFAAALTEANAITIASRASATAGPTDIDICFYVESNTASPDSGDYRATIVLRAVAS